MSDVFRQQVSDQSTDDVRPQRRQIIVSGLPLKSWRSWQWGHTAYVVTTSIPVPPRVGGRTPVRTTRLQCVGASGRTRTSCRLSRTRSSRTDTTRWPSPVSSTTGYHAPRRRMSATLSRHRAQPSSPIGRATIISLFVRFRYARDRRRRATANPARVLEDGREASPRVRPLPRPLGSAPGGGRRRRAGGGRGPQVPPPVPGRRDAGVLLSRGGGGDRLARRPHRTARRVRGR